jgi:hypothetical protein
LLQNYYKVSILFSFLFPTTKADHPFPPQRLVRTSVSPNSIGSYLPKEKKNSLPIIQVRLLKRRRRCLAWWPMEGEGESDWLGGQWKEKEKVFFYLFHFSPQTILLKPSFFILHIKVLLCPGPRPLFRPSLRFPWPINHDCVS